MLFQYLLSSKLPIRAAGLQSSPGCISPSPGLLFSPTDRCILLQTQPHLSLLCAHAQCRSRMPVPQAPACTPSSDGASLHWSRVLPSVCATQSMHVCSEVLFSLWLILYILGLSLLEARLPEITHSDSLISECSGPGMK